MVTFHLEEVAEMLEDFLKDQEINRVAVGGPVEAVSQFQELLSPWVQEKVTAYLSIEMTAGEKDLVDEALRVLEEVEREQEDQLVEELLSRVAKGDRAAIGIDDVVAKVEQGQVHRLIVAAEFERPGYRCPNCGTLFAQRRETCFYCGYQLEEIPNLIDHIVKEAVNQGAKVEVVKRDHPRLLEAGGIGAFLRF
jgi:peptide subunit release factor 1 (eRF1)